MADRTFRTLACLSCLSLAALASACTHPSPVTPPAWSYDEQVGLIVTDANQSCLTTKAANTAPLLAAGTRMTVIDPGSPQPQTPRLRQAVVVRPADDCVAERDRDPARRGYLVQFDRNRDGDAAAPPAPSLGIAIIGARPPRFALRMAPSSRTSTPISMTSSSASAPAPKACTSRSGRTRR